MQSLRNHFRSVYRNSVREFLRSNRCSLNQWDATYIIYQLIPKNNHKRLDLTALPAQPVPPGFQASRRHLSYMLKLWIIMKENMLHPIQAEKVEVPGMAWHLCLCVLMSRYQFDVANLTNLTFFLNEWVVCIESLNCEVPCVWKTAGQLTFLCQWCLYLKSS